MAMEKKVLDPERNPLVRQIFTTHAKSLVNHLERPESEKSISEVIERPIKSRPYYSIERDRNDAATMPDLTAASEPHENIP